VTVLPVPNTEYFLITGGGCQPAVYGNPSRGKQSAAALEDSHQSHSILCLLHGAEAGVRTNSMGMISPEQADWFQTRHTRLNLYQCQTQLRAAGFWARVDFSALVLPPGSSLCSGNPEDLTRKTVVRIESRRSKMWEHRFNLRLQ
jgi:hypothetical protein